MRKLIALLIVALLICGAAVAEPDAPAMKNPEERYEAYMEQTDGSEYAVFVMLDSANDEAADVAEHGAVNAHHRFLDENGETTQEVTISVQDSEFGHMVVSTVGEGLLSSRVYTLGARNYLTFMGVLGDRFEEGTQEDFDWYWESYHFPYGSLDTLNGMRQDENGYTYFLIKSDDTMSFEFAVGEGMRIEQLRSYTRDANGDLALDLIVDYSVGAALPVPEAVQAAIREDLGIE